MARIRLSFLFFLLVCAASAVCLSFFACSGDDDDDSSEMYDFCNKIAECDMLDRFDFGAIQDCLTDYEQIGYERANCVTFTSDCEEMGECLDEVEGDEDDSGSDPGPAADDDDDEEEDLLWKYFPVKGAKCRDNSDTGIGVRLNPDSDNVAIFMDGGGACVTLPTCLSTPSRFDENKLRKMSSDPSWDLYAGIFNPENHSNPVRDWNMVYIPYCTGDMHMGNKEDALVLGLLKRQQFVGFPNIRLFITMIRKIFPNPPKVILSGMSAGGFGTLIAYPVLADAFPDSELILIDDSGPLFEDDQALSPCYQSMMRLAFNIDPSLPDDCDECAQPDGDGLVNIFPYLAETYPEGRFGLISTTADRSIRGTFGPGQFNCLAMVGFGSGVLSRGLFSQALFDLRDDILLPTGRWSTFFAEGTTHGVLPYEYESLFASEASYYKMEADGVMLTEWIAEMVDHVADPVGP